MTRIQIIYTCDGCDTETEMPYRAQIDKPDASNQILRQRSMLDGSYCSLECLWREVSRAVGDAA